MVDVSSSLCNKLPEGKSIDNHIWYMRYISGHRSRNSWCLSRLNHDSITPLRRTDRGGFWKKANPGKPWTNHGKSQDFGWFWMIFGLKHPRLSGGDFFQHGWVCRVPPQTREITKSSGVPDDSLELIWEWMCQSEPLVNDDLGSWGSEKTSFSKKTILPHQNSFSPARFLYRSV